MGKLKLQVKKTQGPRRKPVVTRRKPVETRSEIQKHRVLEKHRVFLTHRKPVKTRRKPVKTRAKNMFFFWVPGHMSPKGFFSPFVSHLRKFKIQSLRTSYN